MNLRRTSRRSFLAQVAGSVAITAGISSRAEAQRQCLVDKDLNDGLADARNERARLARCNRRRTGVTNADPYDRPGFGRTGQTDRDPPSRDLSHYGRARTR